MAGELVLLSAPPSTDSGRIDAAVERLALVPTMVLATPDCPLSAPGVAPLADAEIAEAGEQLDIELATARSPLPPPQARGGAARGGIATIAEGLQLESAVFAALRVGRSIVPGGRIDGCELASPRRRHGCEWSAAAAC
ncbi:MAG: hypothetical protein IPG46_20145 [Actinobacteria bacterium]|nr:hypothetical protein [Actinomycetota bacterium]